MQKTGNVNGNRCRFDEPISIEDLNYFKDKRIFFYGNSCAIYEMSNFIVSFISKDSLEISGEIGIEPVLITEKYIKKNNWILIKNKNNDSTH